MTLYICDACSLITEISIQQEINIATGPSLAHAVTEGKMVLILYCKIIAAIIDFRNFKVLFYFPFKDVRLGIKLQSPADEQNGHPIYVLAIHQC
ncbi:Malformin synthetase mlfA [Trichinella spiralis]|uniref:Malformin synthetase mlfA n=1 Tax=Trichinella spiralis TaxID=6334 RepID=A0ABR3KEW4_TRISP